MAHLELSPVKDLVYENYVFNDSFHIPCKTLRVMRSAHVALLVCSTLTIV